ncbi:P-loop containing nucleoside triphosphate hydrolase protein [Crucibulum laeve]|uniref:RNA helicase n=1 Tax=Crucibulum laeve TaxID=68775 RepID=A0A5C3LUF0_9AGAR|nr:P-loop containing nucleoside triphosphate hydrolase protein [Crucibulum laeve]
MSRSAEEYADAIAAQQQYSIVDNQEKKVTFEDLGLHPPIVASLRTAFPNVQHPTETQSKFIPAILGEKDVLLKDETGSGKSFGLMVALLNKPRLKSMEKRGNKNQERRHITSLVIVPHRDLAYQLLHWVERMVNAVQGSPPPAIESIAQVLVRDGGQHLTTGFLKLEKTVPHILIGTPQALMDVYKQDPNALQLSHLSSVVVDEVDYLIETVPKKSPGKSFRGSYEKANKKLKAHPGATRELLDLIYYGRKEVNERRRDEPGLAQYDRSSGQADDCQFYPPAPQLILSSATLRVHLNNYLFDESGWLNRDNLVKVRGFNRSPQRGMRNPAPLTGGEESLRDSLGGRGISHSVLLVSELGIRNVSGARRPTASVTTDVGTPLTPEVVFGSPVVPDNEGMDPRLAEKYARSVSPFNPNTFEAIATAFALDVPSVALLVLPASAPLQRAIYELREMGVNAHGLDLLANDKGRSHLLSGGGTVQENPTLLVSTLATTRGLDLPELTHVFILGIPEGPKVSGRSVDAYLHLAGRVGRFGRGGKVITVVEEKEDAEEHEEETDEEDRRRRRAVVTDASKMMRILKEIQTTPVQFEHFD